MLTRIIATMAALAVIGLAAIVAALPITAQSDGDPPGSGATAPTATPTATPIATPTPTPTSFAIRPHIGDMKPHGLTRMGNKWYVAGYGGPGRIHVFSDNGTLDGQLGLADVLQGITNDGTNLIAVTGFKPRLYTWNPSTDSLVSLESLPNPPDGGEYRARAVALEPTRDGANTWSPSGGRQDRRCPKNTL